MTETLTTESFATKYRPVKLKDMVGQKSARNQVAGFLKSGKLPRALLITGSSGNGKTSLGRIIARHINKVIDVTEENDIIEVNIGTNGTADEIKDLVSRLNYLPRNINHKKIYILDEVHCLTKTSASALLKEIEEPPAHVIFILCTNEPDKLLDTIKGRCEKIVLTPYTKEDIMELLHKVCEAENLNIKEEYLEKIAESSSYQPRESLATLQGVANIVRSGSSLDESQLEERISAAVKNNIFDLCNTFLKALYVKKYSACVRCIDQADAQAESLINIALFSNGNLIKYFATVGGNSKYSVKLPYPQLKLKDEISQLTKNYAIEDIVRVSSQIQQMLMKSLREARMGITCQNVLFSNVGEYCYGSDMENLVRAVNFLVETLNAKK